MSKSEKKLGWGHIYLWTPQRLLSGMLLLMALLAYLIYFNFTHTQTDKLVNLQLEESTLKNSLSYKYRLVKSVPLYLNKTSDLAALESQIKQRFPQAEELPSVLIQINQIAEDSNVNISSFIPKEIKEMKLAGVGSKDGRIMAETFALNGVASYANLINFIYRIAQLTRVFEISNLQLIRIDDESLNLNFDLIIFYSSE